MLQPKRKKYNKSFRLSMKGDATSGAELAMGEFALQSTTRSWIDSRQLEAARKALVREMKRKGKLWIRIFPHLPYTKKPAETRQGSGKGSPEGWVAVVRPGRILFEVDGVARDAAKEALRLASNKLPIKTKFVTRIDLTYNEAT